MWALIPSSTYSVALTRGRPVAAKAASHGPARRPVARRSSSASKESVAKQAVNSAAHRGSMNRPSWIPQAMAPVIVR